MKKIISIIAVMALALGCLSGCGEDNASFALGTLKTAKYVTTLGQYKGLTVTAEKTEITDELLDYCADMFFNQMAQGITWNDPAKMGDTVVIDFVGKIDGEAFQGGTGEGYYLTLGSGQFIPGFEEELVGVKTGDVKDVNVTFPEDYGKEELSGKPAVFTCTVHNVIPTLSDDAVKKLNNELFSDMKSYKEYLTGYLKDMADSEYEENVLGSALEQIISSSVIKEVPEQLIKDQEATITETFRQQSIEQAKSLAELLAEYGTNMDELSLKYAKRQLICQTIANAEGLNVSDDELNEEAAKFVETSEDYTTVEEFLNDKGIEKYRNYLMNEKVYDFLMNNTNIVAPEKEDTTETTQE